MGKSKRKDEYVSKKRIVGTFYSIFKKHWYIYLIIVSIPSAWFSAILPYWGKFFHLIDENGFLTVGGTIATIIIMIVVAFIVFSHDSYLKCKEENDIEEITGKISFLQEIIKNVDNICAEKLSSIKNRIVDEKELEKAMIISNPNNQLKRIIEGITECLVNLLNNDKNNFKFGDFFVTIAYNFPQDNADWQWTEGNSNKDMELDELLKPDCLSTFNYILKTHKPYYFNNSKEEAKTNGQYAYTPLDELSAESKEIVGSIFCYRYQIKKGNTVYVDAMLSITTQKKRFAEENVESCKNVRENMISIVKDHFEKRIGIELSLLYLEFLKSQEKSIS